MTTPQEHLDNLVRLENIEAREAGIAAERSQLQAATARSEQERERYIREQMQIQRKTILPKYQTILFNDDAPFLTPAERYSAQKELRMYSWNQLCEDFKDDNSSLPELLFQPVTASSPVLQKQLAYTVCTVSSVAGLGLGMAIAEDTPYYDLSFLWFISLVTIPPTVCWIVTAGLFKVGRYVTYPLRHAVAKKRIQDKIVRNATLERLNAEDSGQ